MGRKAMADARAMEKQAERRNPVGKTGATPSMGVSQMRGGAAVPSSGLSAYRGGSVYLGWDDAPEEEEDEMVGGAVPAEEAEESDDDMDALLGGAIDAFGKEDDDGEELLGGAKYEKSESESESEEEEMKGKGKKPMLADRVVDKPAVMPRMPMKPPACAPAVGRMPRFQPAPAPDMLMGSGKSKKMSEAAEMGLHLGKHLHSLHGAGFWSDFNSGLSMAVLPEAKELEGAGKKKVKKGGQSGAYEGKGLERVVGAGLERAVGAGMERTVGAGKKKRAPAGASDGRRKRAEVVKKVMAEKKLSMIEASKYVKAHGLY